MTDMSCPRAHRIDLAPTPTGHFQALAPRRSLAGLEAEARRLARRRSILEAGAAGARAPRSGAPASRRTRAARATRLAVAFHRVLDDLHAVGGHAEALTAFRAYRTDLVRRTTGAGVSGPNPAAAPRPPG